MTYSGNQISNALENNSFTVFFMHSKLRRECKKDYMEVGDNKVGSGNLTFGPRTLPRAKEVEDLRAETLVGVEVGLGRLDLQ